MDNRTSVVFAWIANLTFIGSFFTDLAVSYGLLLLAAGSGLAALTSHVHGD
jgi:hypothetical protein